MNLEYTPAKRALVITSNPTHIARIRMAAKRILGDLDELELLPWYDNRDLTGYALVILEPSDGSLKTQLKDVSIAGKVVVVSDMIYGSHLVSALLKNGIQAERVAYNDLSTYYLTPNP